MELSRREFSRLGSLGIGSLLLSSWMSCDKSNDLVSSLRGILQAVEKALTALSLLSGLLPDVVNTAADYLIKVCNFVDAVGQILESSAVAADKASQILTLASDLVLPVVPPPVGPILASVVVAVNHFLSFFGTDINHAGAVAKTRVANVPDMNFDSKQREKIDAIARDAQKDRDDIKDWRRKAMAAPAKK